MAASCIIDVNVKLVHVILADVVTLKELLDGRKRMLADPDFDPTFSQLLDLRPVTSLRLSGDNVKELADAHVFAAGARRVLIVPNPIYFSMARLFEIYRRLAGGKDIIHIVQEPDSARRWLGLPAGYPLA
jgi:hypothetical protein